ncbi:MAG TPA: MucR family transcriptional regulator [bacterium]
MIRCCVCHGEYKDLNHKHLARHGLTPAEYKKEFNVKTTKSPETRLKITLRNKKNWELPQYRRLMTANIKAARAADKEKYSRLRKELWKDPVYRRKMEAFQKSEKRSQVVSRQMKEIWKDPKSRAKAQKAIRALWNNPKTKTMMLKKRFSHPDVKKKIGLARKKAFQNPHQKAKWHKARWGHKISN